MEELKICTRNGAERVGDNWKIKRNDGLESLRKHLSISNEIGGNTLRRLRPEGRCTRNIFLKIHGDAGCEFKKDGNRR